MRAVPGDGTAVRPGGREAGTAGTTGESRHPGEPQLGAQFAIRSIPTMVLFKGGREVARQSGAMASADIVRWVQSRL